MTFVDTSAFLVVLDADDPNHEAAKLAWTGMVAQAEQMITTNYVVVETASILHHRHGVPAVRWFFEDMLAAVDIEWVSADTHGAAMRAVLAGSRRGPSLVDCVSFETIATLGASFVFAYDEHFRSRGFSLIGQ